MRWAALYRHPPIHHGVPASQISANRVTNPLNIANGEQHEERLDLWWRFLLHETVTSQNGVFSVKMGLGDTNLTGKAIFRADQRLQRLHGTDQCSYGVEAQQ